MFIYEKEIPVIAKNSLVDCHVRGMDSVIFDNTPGRRIRTFCLRPEHEMWTNLGLNCPLSLSIHPHHCDLELRPVFGESYNVIPTRGYPGHRKYTAWRYESAITGTGTGSFTALPESHSMSVALVPHELRRPWRMHAKELHTFYVPRGKEAAWTVYEGKEDETYDSTCWSDADLSLFDSSVLYQPMSEEYLKKILHRLKVNII